MKNIVALLIASAALLSMSPTFALTTRIAKCNFTYNSKKYQIFINDSRGISRVRKHNIRAMVMDNNDNIIANYSVKKKNNSDGEIEFIDTEKSGKNFSLKETDGQYQLKFKGNTGDFVKTITVHDVKCKATSEEKDPKKFERYDQ